MALGTTVETSVPTSVDIDLEVGDPVVPLEDAPDAPDPAIEARAREMGWKPLAEYRGPPGKWQPAADFIARGENILPIMRQQNRALSEKVGRMEGEFTSMRKTLDEQTQIIKDLRDMGRKADQRGYERAMAEIKSKQREAVAAGDTTSYDQLVAQAEALASERPAAVTAEPPPVPPQTPPALREPTKQFIAGNPWFNTDKLLADTMINLHREVLQERQVTEAMQIADPAFESELLEEAKQRVMERYPDRFGAPAREPPPRTPAPPRRRAAAVAQPTPDAPTRTNGAAATIASIQDPEERTQARDAFNRMKRNMPDYTEAEYMALYADPHGDILVMQQQKPRA